MLLPAGRKAPHAFTLLELVIVVAILGVLAGVVLLNIGSVQEKTQIQSTNTTLELTRDAIIGAPGGIGYQADMRGLPLTLAALYNVPAGAAAYNPVTRLGWRGPYLKGATGVLQINTAMGYTSTYGIAGDPAPIDAWKGPIIIQFPADSVTTDPAQKALYARLISAGPDGIIQTPAMSLYPTTDQRGDDIVLFLNRPDVPPTP